MPSALFQNFPRPVKSSVNRKRGAVMYFHVRLQNALKINKRPIFFPKGFYCSQNPVKFRWKHFRLNHLRLKWSVQNPLFIGILLMNKAFCIPCCLGGSRECLFSSTIFGLKNIKLISRNRESFSL